jgi:hypothetical protein
MLLSTVTLSAILGALTTAAPLIPKPILRQNNFQITSATIQTISPDSASCTNADKPLECRTSDLAAKAITDSFAQYKVICPHEKAALIAWMAFESGSYKYHQHYFPSFVAGQGTRTMMSSQFTSLYAQATLPADQWAQVQGNGDAIIQALLPDELSFGSAAWFLTTQCSPQVRTALQSGSEDGARQFFTSCVYTSYGEDRATLWEAAHAQVGTGIQ